MTFHCRKCGKMMKYGISPVTLSGKRNGKSVTRNHGMPAAYDSHRKPDPSCFTEQFKKTFRRNSQRIQQTLSVKPIFSAESAIFI